MEIIGRINWVDVLVIIVIIRISYVAFREGLSHEIFPLLGSLAIIVICLHYYSNIGQFISENLVNIPVELSNFLSFLVLAVIMGFTLRLLKVVLDRLIRVEWHPIIERFGGLAAGALRAYLVASITLMTIALMPLPYLQWSIRDKSLTGMHFLRVGPSIYCRVYKFLPTIKVDKKTVVDREGIVRDIASDKSVLPKAKKAGKKTDEWEKI